MMAGRARTYPQVTPTAADLVDGAVVAAPAALSAGDGLRLARRRGVDVLAAGARGFVLREDLARAESLGVGDLPLHRLTRPLPALPARAGEITVRRALAAGAPAVIVLNGRAPVGVVRRAPAPAPISMQARLARMLDAESLELLAEVGLLAAAHGAAAYLVGGLVRDAWLADHSAGGVRPPRPRHHDLDVAIDGDALTVARALADARRGTLVEHQRFLTASVTLPGDRRLDLVTTRSERYEGGGALPRVLPAPIAQDLKSRRDFTVNAMAVELGSGTFGLLDPLGGAADVGRRTLRVLHPLSFVEDPTRIFRAARYAARLGFSLDPWSARARALALELAPYAELSPARIAAELERILADAAPERALVTLARAGAFRLLDPRYRPGRATERLARVPATLAWARERRLAVPGLELLAAALAAGQPREVATVVLRQLGLRGAPLERVRAALDGARELATRLDGAARASEAARLTRGSSPTALAWLYLEGSAAARARLERRLAPADEGRPELNGDAVIALGAPRGPEVAQILGALRDARLDGEIVNRQGEIDYVKSWLHHHKEREG